MLGDVLLGDGGVLGDALTAIGFGTAAYGLNRCGSSNFAMGYARMAAWKEMSQISLVNRSGRIVSCLGVSSTRV